MQQKIDETEFVKRLQSIPSSREEYLKYGVDEETIGWLIDRFTIEEKKHPRLMMTTDPLVRLVEHYDVSTLEIGMICFNAVATDMDDYWYVARFEVDYICVSKITGEVVLFSFDDLSKAPYRCACNSASFLAAILAAARFLHRCGYEDDLYEDQSVACAMAKECAELAGGDEYVNFFKWLVACFS